MDMYIKFSPCILTGNEYFQTNLCHRIGQKGICRVNLFIAVPCFTNVAFVLHEMGNLNSSVFIAAGTGLGNKWLPLSNSRTSVKFSWSNETSVNI